jgi:Cdc6-like AAA superfamily ATPase
MGGADIAGVPGTGKTATVHAVVKELKRKAEDGVSTLYLCLLPFIG